MRNLKKILALALALVMSMSLVSIASATDFSDDADIEYQEAVEVLTALEVIDGVGNNTFNPNGTVTRAQMAKMITIISLGNVDVSAFQGTATDLKDIAGHWAEAYIKYCYSQGVIAGKGAGIFDPNANVTTAEAAKMLLVALGYNSDVQGYEGSQWAINVTRDAQLSGFYDELSVTANQALTRQQAAQMIYNAVQAYIIVRENSMDLTTGNITVGYHPSSTDTLLTETFNVKEEEGALTYDATDYDADKGEYTYTVDSKSYKTTEDYTNLYQQNVKVLFYDKNDDGNFDSNEDKVYGIYPSSKGSVMATGLVADIKLVSGNAQKVKIGSTEYNLSKANTAIDLVSFLAGTTLDTLNDIDTYKATDSKTPLAYEIALIDNDGDNKGDVIVVYPFTVEKVSFVGTNSFTTAAVVSGVSVTGTANKKFEDVIAYDGLAKDDYVKVTAAASTATNKVTLEKLELVESKAQAVKVTDGQIQFNSAWYKTDIVGTAKAQAGSDSEYVAVNGYLFYLDGNAVLTGVEDFAVVKKAAAAAAGLDATWTTQLLKADGETVTVEATTKGNPGELYKIDENDDGYTVLTAVNNASVTSANSDFDVIFADGTDSDKDTDVSGLTYTKDNDGNYFVYSSNNYYISDDAVVFVYNAADSSYSVTTGARLKATNTNVTGEIFAAAVKDSATGYTNVALAYVKASSAITTDAKAYGYVVDDTVKYEDGTNKFYTQITFWDGSGVQTLNTKTVTNGTGVVADAYAMVKGDVFTYELNADGTIETLTEYNQTGIQSGDTAAGNIDIAAVVGNVDNMLKVSKEYFTKADGTETGSTYTKDLKITDDTVIIYVSAADTEGAEGGSIQLASRNEISGNESNYANVLLISTSGSVDLLVVDVNNDILALQ